MDKEDIEPGLWKNQIQKAIPKSRYFLFCVSKVALQKTADDGMVRDWQPKQGLMPPGWQCRCPDGCSERHGGESLYCDRHHRKYCAPQQAGSRQSGGRKAPPRLDLV